MRRLRWRARRSSASRRGDPTVSALALPEVELRRSSRFLALAVLYWCGRQPDGGATIPRSARAGQLLLLFLLSVVVLNLGYGFQGSGRPLH